MLNFNGELLPANTFLISSENRAYQYGDALFETVKVQRNKIAFWEDHYFRLMASMRMLRMKIPMNFTLEFLQEEILKTVVAHSKTTSYRVRISVSRKEGGLYTPLTNEIDYLIKVSENTFETKDTFTIDIFKDFYNSSGLMSTLKTTNRMLNTVASIYAFENDLDACILINERKGVVEVTNGNIFVVKDNIIKTPALTEGCIKGVVRKKIIEIIHKNPDYTIEETVISPFEIQKADEVFITNAIMGIQAVTHYRKKIFQTEIGAKLSKNLLVVEMTS
mgnify:CR=1 FL=1